MEGEKDGAIEIMYELKIISQFAAAHQLRDFGGKCENLHGHNWKIEVYVTGKNLGNDGLLIDFALVKGATDNVLGELDHKFLNDMEYFKTTNPSSENIAHYIHDLIGQELNSEDITVSRVSAWESDTACATYMEP
jgi:6-pyruvoyltetrahydropterin/6-carboxytetrahydropterin synthase